MMMEEYARYQGRVCLRLSLKLDADAGTSRKVGGRWEVGRVDGTKHEG
jgi:hypothetical protein